MNSKKAFYIRLTIAIFIGLLSLLAFTGLIYPIKIFDLQLGALIQRVFIDFSIIAITLLLFILIATFVFGRFYCSIICPLGLLQELVTSFKTKRYKHPKLFLKYIVMTLFFGTVAGGTVYFFRYLEPYTYFGAAFSLSIPFIIIVAIILVITFFKGRIFCTQLCPVGTLLGIISKYSLKKLSINESCLNCKKCEMHCPTGSIDCKNKTIDNETCIKCLKCTTVCPKNGIKYGCVKNSKINLKKRQMIVLGSFATVFLAAAKIGNIVKKFLATKFSDVIMPPGAISEMRFLNKCLNCNLCAKVCPTRIIKKADGKFKAVSIDYSNGFCEYTCNDCTSVCPTGALKRLSLERKQNLRIGMISPPTTNFETYAECVEKCPTKALIIREGNPDFIPLKCIGCGTCVSLSNGNITIYGTSEQRFLH